MQPKLEHANLVVRDIDATIRFLTTAFPQFTIRYDSAGAEGERWVHIGTRDTYLSLTRATAEASEPWVPYSGRAGVNHLGFEVDDVDALRARMQAAGYRDNTVPNGHPYRTRVYFHDPDGNDWEFVQYHSDDPAERNDYEKVDPLR